MGTSETRLGLQSVEKRQASNLEGSTLDREVRAHRDKFVTLNYAKILYNGLYLSPERESLQATIVASQGSVNGAVRCRCFKSSFPVLGRWSDTEKPYDMNESSMDEIGDFEPQETTGFIGANAIRLKKYGRMEEESGVILVGRVSPTIWIQDDDNVRTRTSRPFLVFLLY